ncbi:MAG: glycosyltransferase family 4 protein [Gaiellaceae bacterium]
MSDTLGPMRPLRVGIDVSALELTQAGTARYVNSLLERLRGDPELDLVEYTRPGRSRRAKLARDLHWYPRLAQLAERDGVELLHCPTQRAPTSSSVPLVVTVHDLAVLRHPRTFNAWTRSYSGRKMPAIARTADHLIAVSSFTRDELVAHLDVSEERVTVVRNGVSPPFEPWGPQSPGHYVLAVSTLEPRKNLTRTLQGFRRARIGGAELRLVGATGWGDASVPRGTSVRLLGRVDDDELAALYRGALCVVYLSLYEGFGLPPLEAMACGAPAVVPDGPPYDEFASGAAVRVDATDPDAIAEGIVEAIERRRELAAAGIDRAGSFSWDAAAQATRRVYQRVACERVHSRGASSAV